MNYIRKSFSIGLFSTFTASVIVLLLSPILIQHVGLEKYGVWAFYNSLLSLSAIFDLGLSRSIVYYVAKATDEDQRQGVAATGFVLTATMALICVLLAPAFYAMSRSAIETNDHDFAAFSLYAPVFVAISLMLSFFRAIFEARLKVHLNHALISLFQILNIVFLCALSALTSDLTLLIGASGLIYLLNILVYAFWTRSIQSWSLFAFDKKFAYRLVKTAKTYFVLGITNAVTIPLNRILIQFFLGPGAHALFDIALKFSMAWNSVVQLLNAPLFSIYIEKKDHSKEYLSFLASRMIFLSSLVHLVGISIAFVFARDVGSVMLPSHADEFVSYFLILFIGVPFSSIAEPIVKYLWSIGKEGVTFLVRLVTLLINAGLFVALYYIGFRNPGALAFSVAMISSTIFYIWYRRDLIDLNVIWTNLRFFKKY